MLEVWGRKNANQVIQVLWTLSELGIEYQRYSVGVSSGDLDTDEYITLNPNSKIPTIRDNGFVLWESHAIIRYLAREYGLGTLYPTDSKQAALSDQWMTWSTDSFRAHFSQSFGNSCGPRRLSEIMTKLPKWRRKVLIFCLPLKAI